METLFIVAGIFIVLAWFSSFNSSSKPRDNQPIQHGSSEYYGPNRLSDYEAYYHFRRKMERSNQLNGLLILILLVFGTCYMLGIKI